MARTKNAPPGVMPVETDSQSKRELIRASLEEFVRRSNPGTLIPSERVLAEQFKVARMTVRAAIDSLESMSLIRRVPGRGSFVQRPLLAQRGALRSFSEDMQLRGMIPGVRRFRVSTSTASAFLAGKLGIQPGDPVYAIERVRTADAAPMALERINLSATRFPALHERMHEDDSLYELLATEYGVHVDNAEQTVTIAQLGVRDAGWLETAAEAPCFAITQSSRDTMGNVVEFGRSLYRGDRYAIQLQVSKGRARLDPV